MSNRKRPIGIMGGMFDPIHFGHLRSALELRQDLELSEVRLIPCANPPHRPASQASAAQRLAMVQCAVASEAALRVDDRELQRDSLSYTVDTLVSLRAELADTPLCLIVGMDAFVGLPTWHQWQTLFELSHIVVLTRPGWKKTISDELDGFIKQRQIVNPKELCLKSAGFLLFWSVTPLEISSTVIRSTLAKGNSVRYLVPDTVHGYIIKHHLYKGT